MPKSWILRIGVLLLVGFLPSSSPPPAHEHHPSLYQVGLDLFQHDLEREPLLHVPEVRRAAERYRHRAHSRTQDPLEVLSEFRAWLGRWAEMNPALADSLRTQAKRRWDEDFWQDLCAAYPVDEQAECLQWRGPEDGEGIRR